MAERRLSSKRKKLLNEFAKEVNAMTPEEVMKDIYSELKEETTTEKTVLQLYQEAVNKIDDYFEYRYKSKEDKEFVMNILDGITKKLKEFNKKY